MASYKKKYRPIPNKTTRANKQAAKLIEDIKMENLIKSTMKSNDERSRQFAIVCVLLQTIAVLNDKFGFTVEQIHEFMMYLQSNADIINGDYASIQDFYVALRDEGTLKLDKDAILDLCPFMKDYLEPDLK